MPNETIDEIEFHVVDHGTEFRRTLRDARTHDDARAFLDDLVGRRDPPSESRSEPNRAGSDTHPVDEAQYRAFEAVMRRRQP
jgi:hypothetical protein